MKTAQEAAEHTKTAREKIQADALSKIAHYKEHNQTMRGAFLRLEEFIEKAYSQGSNGTIITVDEIFDTGWSHTDLKVVQELLRDLDQPAERATHDRMEEEVMNILNDRKPCTGETWVDDSGKLRHFCYVQEPGKPFRVYLDGVEVVLVPKAQHMADGGPRLA